MSWVSAPTMLKDVLVYHIGKKLSLIDFAVLARVSLIWHAMIQSSIDEKLIEEISFGKNQWLGIPGVVSVSEEVTLTEAQKKQMVTKLKSNCVFFNAPDSIQPHRFQNDKIKKTWETHRLIFFPETVNGKPRTINNQNTLSGTIFHILADREGDEFCNQPAPKSHWGLVMLDVVPGSRETCHEIKESLLEYKGYKVLTPNDAVTSNLIINLPVKEKRDYFFGKEGDWTYIATTEVQQWGRLVVGATDFSEFSVDYDFFAGSRRVGAAGVMEVS